MVVRETGGLGLGGAGGVRVMETMEYLFMNVRDWVPMGSEGSSEV